MDDELIDKLMADPQNVAQQLKAMTEISEDARTRHRESFDNYLIAAARLLAHPA